MQLLAVLNAITIKCVLKSYKKLRERVFIYFKYNPVYVCFGRTRM